MNKMSRWYVLYTWTNFDSDVFNDCTIFENEGDKFDIELFKDQTQGFPKILFFGEVK